VTSAAEVQLRLLKRLAARDAGEAQPGAFVGEVPASDYLSPARFALEQERVFAREPQVVAAECEVAGSGSCLATEIAGIGVLITRGADGALRAFRNACRHRSTRLVEPGAPCVKKALVCPYHGWTYDLAGRLIHVPRAEAFEGRERERERLTPVHVAARHGLVFASLEAFDADALTAPIAELADFGLAGHFAYRRVEREVRGNWKLTIDAFLEAYHVRHLHRGTIYRFFADSSAEVERAGPHIRALTARRALADADLDRAEDVRQLATPTYYVFPNAIAIFHPDYVSVVISTPLAPGRSRFTHVLAIPGEPADAAEAEHRHKSFELIDSGVFLAEDLFAVEAMQAGLESGASSSLLFGEHEFAALWFHESLGERCAAGVSAARSD
jgi:phenylpropionate dioxygenase-like ring-hydroxylating dioxygenase large terminal subunit